MKRSVGGVVMAVVLLAACADADLETASDSVESSTETEVETTTTSSTSTTSTISTTSTTSPVADPLDRLNRATTVDTNDFHEADFGDGLMFYEGIAFDSPSHNITCQILSGASDGSVQPPPSLTCNIRERNADPAPPTGGCGDLVWHRGLISLDPSGDVHDGTCAPDAGPTSARVLPYGHAVVGDGFGCVSEETGMTCLVVDSGLGFQIRRAGLDRY